MDFLPSPIAQVYPEDWLLLPEAIKRQIESLESTVRLSQNNEILYRQVVQNQTDLILRSLPDTTITFANDALCFALGKPLAEVIGLRWCDFVPPEECQEIFIKIAALTPEQSSFENVNQDYRSDGKIGWTQWLNQGIFDDQGQLLEIQSVGRDVTRICEIEFVLRDMEERQRTILNLNHVGTWDWDLPKDTLIWNDQVFELLNLDPTLTPTYSAFIKAVHPDDVKSFETKLVNALENQTDFDHEFRVILPQGSMRWLQAKATGFHHQGKTVRLFGILLDITQQKQTEQDRKESEDRYRLLAENMNDLVCLHDLKGRSLYISPSCETLLGYPYTELIQENPYPFFHPDDRDRVYREVRAAIQKVVPVPITYRIRHKNGHYIWFETLIKAIVNRRGTVVKLQTTSRNVTERVKVQQQLEYDAFYDPLTGLANRNFLMERLELAIQRSHRFETYFYAVLFLDLDRFKVINDSLGHLAGDQLLITIAHKLQSMLRTTDLAARLGGDEFVILLEEIKDLKEIIRIVDRIFAMLRSPILMGEREVYVTTSIGIAFGSPHYQEPSDLLRDADTAMYRAKHEGKARYVIFDSEMHNEAIARLHLENDLRQAIEQEQFILYYQPIVHLESGEWSKLEVLVRWQHPQRGLLSPFEFIPIAEEIGLITPLSYWILKKACQQLVNWQSTFSHLSGLKICVNLSTQDLRCRTLLTEVDKILKKTGLSSHCLTLEITEGMLIENIEASIHLLEALRHRNIEISIDDFGTGYSSLSYLHRLPINHLKIDRSFITQMDDHQRNYQIIETIITLSNRLGLDTIAEGIETQEQLQQLFALGCQLGQGYFLSNPLSEVEIWAILNSQQ